MSMFDTIALAAFAVIGLSGWWYGYHKHGEDALLLLRYFLAASFGCSCACVCVLRTVAHLIEYATA